MQRKLLLTLACVVAALTASAGLRDYSIIVTTPGYTSVYQYDNEAFADKVAKDFRITVPVFIDEAECNVVPSRTMVHITIGSREYNFAISEEAPFIRLVYDRNKRTFTGAGFNQVYNENVMYEAPSFQGVRIDSISNLLAKDVERYLDDRSLLSADSATVFVLEADIDENCIVHNVVELSGELKQYSKVIIDRFYDKAVRGWEPAKVDGVPCRSLAQFTFKLSR